MKKTSLLAAILLILFVTFPAYAGNSIMGGDAKYVVTHSNAVEDEKGAPVAYVLDLLNEDSGSQWATSITVNPEDMKLLLQHFRVSDYKELEGKAISVTAREALSLLISSLKKRQ